MMHNKQGHGAKLRAQLLFLQNYFHDVSAPKNPTGKKYKIINFNPVYEKVKIYRESDYKGS